MKRTLALLAAAAVVATPLVSEAAPKTPKKSTRTVSFDYSGFSAGAISLGASFSLNNCNVPDQCMDFDTVKGEKNVKIAATDATGRPVGMQVWLDGDYQGSVAYYCGAASIKVGPKAAHVVSVRMTPIDNCQGLPTEGTVKATITNF